MFLYWNNISFYIMLLLGNRFLDDHELRSRFAHMVNH